ncbi:MAG: hypothetical protein, partial [Olavius algarvensis Gamma 1 endosymbiont]
VAFDAPRPVDLPPRRRTPRAAGPCGPRVTCRLGKGAGTHRAQHRSLVQESFVHGRHGKTRKTRKRTPFFSHKATKPRRTLL